ncbi:MAG: hypothetical protein RR956_07065 [Christensenella sp.]
MKSIKRICCCFFASAALICAFNSPAAALRLNPGTPPLPQGEITEITQDYLSAYGSFSSHPATLFSVGCPASDIINTLPYTIDGIIGATGDLVPCDVTWTPPDTSKIGWIQVEGILCAPPMCTFAPGLEKVTFPIMLYQDGCSIIDTASQLFLYNDRMETYIAEALTIDSNLNTLRFPNYSAVAVYPNNQYYEVPVTWDLSSINTSKVGEYTVVGTPVMPSCFTYPTSFVGFHATVYVVDSTEISLQAVTQKSLSSITCEWQKTVPDPENIILKYSDISADSHFKEDPILSSGNIASGTRIQTNYAQYTGNKLSISLNKLETEKEYYFQLSYKGTLSDILCVKTKESGLPSTNGIGGDRDGGDRAPTATAPATPTSVPPAVIAPPATVNSAPPEQTVQAHTQPPENKNPAPENTAPENPAIQSPVPDTKSTVAPIAPTTAPLPSPTSVPAQSLRRSELFNDK